MIHGLYNLQDLSIFHEDYPPPLVWLWYSVLAAMLRITCSGEVNILHHL